jgi:hypothetical protein
MRLFDLRENSLGGHVSESGAIGLFDAIVFVISFMNIIDVAKI